jgi:ABC-type multidrug transport system ATPase subunit/pSer/pThr/pTyr-binding forkhead associated (FHA) protein
MRKLGGVARGGGPAAGPELRVVGGGGPARFELPDGETVVGRGPGCGLAVRGRGVAARHARLVREAGRAWVEDLSGEPGTLVNGRSVRGRVPLAPGDEITLGAVTLRYAAGDDLPDAGRCYARLLRSVAPGDRAAPVLHGEPARLIPVGPAPLVLGRAAGCDVLLRDDLVADRHAAVEAGPGGCAVTDLGSDTGTFVNGRGVRQARLGPGDLLQLGPFLFHFDGVHLLWLRPPAALTVVAVGLRQRVGRAELLDGVDFLARPGEFVGVLGPSGAGKTTLLNALSGLRPATAGQVFVNGEPLYEGYDRWRRLIGYVPQEEIVHPELTVRQAFGYAARLRLPADVPAEERAAVVGETLAVLDLADRADQPITSLSAGQRKRASVGVELLGRPRALFLDEPTSGLDPATETRLMRTFRDLARQGRTVVCTTHVVDNVDLFDRVAVLGEGGRLAFFGTPGEARAFFGVGRFTELFERLVDRPAAEWQAEFRRSRPGRELRRRASAGRAPREFHGQGAGEAVAPLSGPRQWALLARRFVRTLTADWRGPRLMLGQPLLIGALVCAVFDELRAVSFLLALSVLWFGCSQAAQQVVKERAVYRRERTADLRLAAYLLSKFVPLTGVCALQALVMLGLVWLTRGHEGSRLVQFLALTLAGANGVAMGLLISACSANADRATAVVPVAMLPQIILGGVLLGLPQMNAPTRAAAELFPSMWANHALEAALLEGRVIDEKLLATKGHSAALWNLYPDSDLGTEQGRVRFLADHRGERVRKAGRVALGGAALAGLAVVQLAAVAVVLRRQDAL